MGTERASECGLTECQGKPECQRCSIRRMERQGMPTSADERTLRRLLALRSGIPHMYYDDGEASGEEDGVRIDFMRDSVADIENKLHALNVLRFAKSVVIQKEHHA